MAFGEKYLFKFDSVHGVEHRVVISQDSHTGSVVQRALGRAPVLKKKQNGPICGTSLELWAECAVEGEFVEFYTSNPKEYKVDLFRANTLVWTGFVSTELYSEPGIAPPYDVQIVATDGLGELKLNNYVEQGEVSLASLFVFLLTFTGSNRPIRFAWDIKEHGSTVPALLNDTLISIDYKAGDTMYDVLTYLLNSFHAVITADRDGWLITRETDIDASAANLAIYEVPAGGGTAVSGQIANVNKSLGQMGLADLWPVGNYSTKIEPARRTVAAYSPWHLSNILTNSNFHSGASGWTADSHSTIRTNYAQVGWQSQAGQASYPTWGYIHQEISLPSLQKGLHLSMRLTVGFNRNYQESFEAGLWVKYVTGSSTYYGDEKGWKTSGTFPRERVPLNMGEQGVEVKVDIPNPGIDTAGTLYVYFGGGGITVNRTECSALPDNKGYKDTIHIDNGARGEDDEVEVLHGRLLSTEYDYAPFLDGVLKKLVSGTETYIYKFSDAHSLDKDFLAVQALSCALSAALPRLRREGVMDIPSSLRYLPLFLTIESVRHFIETYDWDLYNDEVNFSALSLPAATITVESESVEILTNSSSMGSSTGSGGGSSSGGSGVTMSEVQTWVTAQGYLTGINSSMVTMALGYVPASQRMALAAPPVVTRLKGKNAYSDDNPMTDALVVRHPLIGITGVEVVLMVYRRRNGRSSINNGVKVWMNKKGWGVAAGNYQICGYAPFTVTREKFGVQDLRTFILKRFLTVSGVSPAYLFQNMTAEALTTTYASTPKAFSGVGSAHMRFGFAVRMVNPAFLAAVQDPSDIKDTCQSVWSTATGRVEPRYFYSSVAPMTAFLRTVGEGNYRNRLDFSLVGDIGCRREGIVFEEDDDPAD